MKEIKLEEKNTFWAIKKKKSYATDMTPDCKFGPLKKAYLWAEDPSGELEEGETIVKVEVMITKVTKEIK